MKTKPALVAVDGVDAAAVLAEARRAAGSTAQAGISRWDASGVFQELAMADDLAGAPSARVLLLLYAADLAFRLRWEIRPGLSEGRTVVAAPYVDTAFAFGRAAGVPAGWMINLFRFAPRAAEQRYVHPPVGRTPVALDGFVGFGAEHMTPAAGAAPRQIIERTAANLRRAEGRLEHRGAAARATARARP